LWTDAWREALGSGWRVQIAFFAICLFAAGALAPLADPDLPIHLAAGEWIAHHHAVPFVEVWAWTRPGAPYWTYSWAIETAYYLILVHTGPWGLHALQGLVYVSLGAVIVLLGHVSRWRPWTTIVVAGLQIAVVAGTDPYLRPQAILAIAMPVTWALVLRARDADRLRWELPALTLVSAIVVNTHLLFPILLAPCVMLFTTQPRTVVRRLTVPAALVLGWLLTPYAMEWVAIYKLNFAPNPVIGPPAIIGEYKPGFTSSLMGGITSMLVPVALLVVPWLGAPRFSRVERFLHGLLWLGGALLFALAARAILVWWLLIIPVVAGAIDLLPSPTLDVVRTAQRAALLALAGAFVLSGGDDLYDPWLRAGTVSWRTIPSLTARSMEPIAAWLDCTVRPGARGRLVTTFNLGGYVPWRLPYLSESVDGRTIFPDSVAKAETYFPPNKAKIPLQPWRTADLAIVPVSFPVASVLDTARGWRRVAITSQLDGPASSIGLWVTERWWSTSGRIPLPRQLIPLPHELESRSDDAQRCN
jgi:hypothetical protein